MQKITLSAANRKKMRDGEAFDVTYQGSVYHITPELYAHAKAAIAAGAKEVVAFPEVLGENRMEQITVVI